MDLAHGLAALRGRARSTAMRIRDRGARPRATRPVRVTITQPYVPEYRLGLWGPLIAELRDQGIEAHVFWGGSQRTIDAVSVRGDLTTPEWATRVPTIEIRWSRRFPPLTFRRLPRAWRRSTMVLTEMQVTNLNAWWALLRRIPVVTMGHGASGTTTGSALGTTIESVQNRLAHHVLTYTPQGRQDVHRMARLPLARISSFDNATDTSRLRAALETADDRQYDRFRDTHEIPSDAKIALYIGALEPYKRIDLLLDSARHVFGIDPSWHLVVAGEGSQADAVRELADSTANVVMLGRIDPSRFASVAKQARVILNPGRIGLVAVDALTMGTPLLTTKGAQHAPEYSYLREDEDVITSDDSTTAYAAAWLRMQARPEALADRPVLDSRRSASIIAGVLTATARGALRPSRHRPRQGSREH